MVEKNWKFNELLAFILIHASLADMDFTEDEKQMIRIEVGEEIFDKMNLIYNQGSEYQNLQKILTYKEQFFSTEEQKQLFLQKMSKQFHADGEYSKLEKIMLHFLERMM